MTSSNFFNIYGQHYFRKKKKEKQKPEQQSDVAESDCVREVGLVVCTRKAVKAKTG